MGGVGTMTRTNNESQNKNENGFLLHLEDVHKRYVNHKGVEFTVLNDIDLKISSNEFISVVGPSGCGKSTLFRLILGSEQPSDGTVLFKGNPIQSPDRNRGIVFQKYSLFPHLTVLDNLIFGLDMEEFTIPGRMLKPFKLRDRRKEYREKAQAFLERVGLGNDGDKYPQQLSGGMRQRVAIAQSLIMEPRILLMDEPFGALDDSTRQDMQLFLLEQWEKTDMTVLFVTHDLEEAVFLASRSLVLSQYYTTDKDRNEGSKIVTDIQVPRPHPRSTDFKYSDQMAQLIRKLRTEGLDPDHRQHIKDFELSHRDAFRTVTKEEWKDNDE
jgi:NitT/TauT family transport system ATP-binding protein